jgi:hypothetical protein
LPDEKNYVTLQREENAMTVPQLLWKPIKSQKMDAVVMKKETLGR